MTSNKVIQNWSVGNFTISNINLVDVFSGSVINNASIHVCDGIIKNIYKKSELTENNNKRNNSLWAIPGLIDSHVHLFEIHKGEKRGAIEKNFEVAKNLALSNIRDALGVGVTCVRDVGAYSAYNNRLRDIVEERPEDFRFRIVSCGHHITKHNGHWRDRGIVWDPQEISLRDIVIREFETGADFIKVMNDDPIFSTAELSVIATTCKENGRKFACHAFKKETIDCAFNAGADTIEHAVCYSEEFCEKVIEKGVAICPTIVSALDSVKDLEDVLECVCDDCSGNEIIEWYEFLKKNLPRTFKAGVKIIAGTDAGTSPTNFQALPREIIQYKKLGATSLQALQSATINSAEALNISDITGSLEVGKSADIVILGKNPLEYFEEAIVDVKMVISRGYIVVNKIDNNES